MTSPQDEPRFPVPKPDAVTAAQQKVLDHYNSGWQSALLKKNQGLLGHYSMTLRAPELALRLAAVSDYFRKETSLPQRLNEMAILLVASRMRSDFIWNVHRGWAVAAGLAEETVVAIAQRRSPPSMAPDEELVYRFVTELQETQRVSDDTFQRVRDGLGERPYVDLIGVTSYYTSLSMIVAAAGVDK